MSMWDYLPVSAFHDRTWSDMPTPHINGAGWWNPVNLLDWQAKAALGGIDQELVKKLDEDPTMYYEGDFDELFGRRKALTDRMDNGPVA